MRKPPVRKGECKDNCARCCSILQFIVFKPTNDEEISWDLRDCKIKPISEGKFLITIEKPCKHLQGTRCTIYDKRPDVCRKYPQLHDAEFLPKECSYRFEA